MRGLGVAKRGHEAVEEEFEVFRFKFEAGHEAVEEEIPDSRTCLLATPEL